MPSFDSRAMSVVGTRRPTPARTGAFTLIELLVVVGVIAILAALLLPALTSAKAAARKARCLSNEKQMAIAWTAYAADNSDNLVLNGETYAPGSVPSPVSPLWAQGCLAHGKEATNVTLFLDPHYALLGSYLASMGVFLCPADKLTVATDMGTETKYRSYGLNCYLGWTGIWDTFDDRLGDPAPWVMFRKATEINSPTTIFTFQDTYSESTCWPMFGVDMDVYSWHFFNWPSVAHSGSGVLGYADGHVEGHKWGDPRTLKPVSTAGFHLHDDVSTGNWDAVWLQARTTVAR